MNRFALLSLFLIAAISAQSQSSVKTLPAPSWVTAFDYPQSPRDTVGAGGFYYLLSEWQQHTEKQEAYFRIAVKVLTPKGLSTASYISVNFDPSYQKLAFHKLIIKRGGQEINVLPHAKFEMLRREENMDRQIYDKSLDAMLNIEDVQVGDIIEYSYSVAGLNPVFDGKVIKSIRLNFGVPLGKSVDRLICRASRKVNYKLFNKAKEPVHEINGDMQSFLWMSEFVPAQQIDDNVPDWYRTYDAAEISEFTSWSDVANWALPLYVQTPADKKVIDSKVEEIKSSNLAPERTVAAAIHFVQDEIRYLSFSDGIQGFRPHDPSVVMKQRFGDCKDKSLLLTTMLRQLGITANPALVNSSAGKTLNESLPSPYAFDHCITQLVLNDTTYWIDPTVSLERGSFKKSRTANYEHALVISPGTTDLTVMKMPAERSTVKLNEVYSFNVVGGSAELTVKTVYTGSQANSMRSYYKSNDKEDIKQNYTNFYANEYPEITMIDYVQYTDNETDNIIESTENYTIENFWTKDSLTGTQITQFYARSIGQYFEQPSTKLRNMPFAISHPVSVIQNITIHVPEFWSVKKSSTDVSSNAFRFTSETDYMDEKIYLRYTYESRKDHIVASEAVKHVKDTDRALEALSFQLTYAQQNETTSAFNIPFLIIGIFALPLIIFGLVWLYKYDPRSRDYEMSYEGFGGWLVLPVIGIFLTPVWAMIEIFKNGFFNYLQWEILTNPSHGSYNPKLGALVLIEYLYEIALLAYSVFVVVLMVRRRTSFPLFASIMYGANVAFVLLDSIWLHTMDLPTVFEGENSTAAMRTILTAIIWIPYIIFSDRVKGTFTERIER
ncbi:DUF3857 domain-containing protein [Chryseolinea sp. T2]|uniref:DUF3857 domain-containing protein n=1 Tax=Chryseolinea sp. T2 TaxID=3129255 RepID=UPI00307708E0